MSERRTNEALSRIEEALARVVQALRQARGKKPDVERKRSGEPVTETDRAINRLLQDALLRDGEGWLSEESRDDLARLGRRRVWIVDPLDGTKEFIADIPEWVVSIGLVEEGRAVAGGVLNPSTGELFLGAVGKGVWYNGVPARVRSTRRLEGGLVLASRSEVDRGEWDAFKRAPFRVQPMGSVAYKLARVAAGLADATWTLVPKNEWDVAAGCALVAAGGGEVYARDGSEITFNREHPLLSGLIAHPRTLRTEVDEQIRRANDR